MSQRQGDGATGDNDELKRLKLQRQIELAEEKRKRQLELKGSLLPTSTTSNMNPNLNLIVPKTIFASSNCNSSNTKPLTSSNVNLNLPSKPYIGENMTNNTISSSRLVVSHNNTDTPALSTSNANSVQHQKSGPVTILVRSSSENSLDQQDSSVAPLSGESQIPKPLDVYDPNIESETKDVKGETTNGQSLNNLTLEEFIRKPAEIGKKVLCKIMRSRESGGKQWYPYYELYLETSDGMIFLLSARKRKKSASSNYVVSTAKLLDNSKKEGVVGKVRSNFLGTSFTLYDNGRNPFKDDDSGNSKQVRCELGSVIYEPNVLGLKGPRKMTTLLPAVDRQGKPIVIRPTKEKDTILERHKQGNRELVLLKNKSPQWNEETQSFVLNFSGRVTMASVKNFQIVHENDVDYIVMQFGRVNDSEFTMDFQYPLSALQAFSIALTSFDAKLACE